MIRGTIPFRCSECGKRFMALDIEWNATVLSTPQQCPKCSSLHTRPWSLLPAFVMNAQYRPIWEVIESQSK